MMPVSGVSTGAAQPLTRAEEMPKVQKPAEEARNRQRKPVMDEYVPEEPREPTGLYWRGRDEDGQPKIYFDGWPQAADAPKQPEDAPEEPDQAGQGAKGPEGEKEEDEIWACNTGKVDREIERLKKKRQELEQRLNTETDESKIKDLERQLAQVERELQQKDNDTYRRQRATVRQIS